MRGDHSMVVLCFFFFSPGDRDVPTLHVPVTGGMCWVSAGWRRAPRD